MVKLNLQRKKKYMLWRNFKNFFQFLKKLNSIFSVGKEAYKIEKKIDLSNYKVFKSYHPSPKVKSISPNLWKTIPNVWQKSIV